MYKSITIYFFLAALILVPSTIQAEQSVSQYPPKVAVMLLADQVAYQTGTSMPLLKAVVRCESSYDPKATHITKWEQSYGLGQINRLAHPGISIQQAEDPTFALNYVAKGLQSNPQAWSCFSKVNRGKIKGTIKK